MTTKNFFRASAEDFKKIPGLPVAYWVSKEFYKSFSYPTLEEFSEVITGMTIGDNNKYLRRWYEVSWRSISVGKSNMCEIDLSASPWIPYSKGGERRNWYGNFDYVVNWAEKDNFNRAKTTLARLYLRPALTWPFITSGVFSARFLPEGSLWDVAGSPCFFDDDIKMYFALAFLCSKAANYILKVVNPTINVQAIDIARLPLVSDLKEENTISHKSLGLISVSRSDWDAYETSWDFTTNPLVDLARGVNNSEPSRLLSALYANLREKWAKDCEEMRRLEMENNRIFIEAYGLQDELTPEVPWQEITLTCNPFYRYGVKEVENAGGDSAVGVCALPRVAELEERLKADTIKELISYGVGCMMGRYSLSKPGLILADQGLTIADYGTKVGEGPYSPDDDGIIPVLDDDCFADDIVTQFEKFLVAAFGAAQLGANRAFIEQALGKDLRSYFVKDFYADHLQRYQKRPIYWLFSSPKGTFNALVYLHRYQPNTAGQVLGYLRSFITKLQAKIEAADKTAADPNASQSFRTRAIKERTKLARQLKELEDYEREVLHPLSLQHVALDLDDGVKVNYLKLGAALKKIPGLEAKE